MENEPITKQTIEGVGVYDVYMDANTVSFNFNNRVIVRFGPDDNGTLPILAVCRELFELRQRHSSHPATDEFSAAQWRTLASSVKTLQDEMKELTGKAVPETPMEITPRMALDALKRAMDADPDYARGWHDNLAIMAQDAGAQHYASQDHAHGFMRRAFGVVGYEADSATEKQGEEE